MNISFCFSSINAQERSVKLYSYNFKCKNPQQNCIQNCVKIYSKQLEMNISKILTVVTAC